MRWLLPIISGLVLSLAYPRWNIEAAVWVWMFPLLWTIWGARQHRTRRPFLTGWLAGLAFFFPNVWWVRHSSRVIFDAVDHSWAGWGPELLGLAAVTGLAGYCALYFGLWTWFAARLRTEDDSSEATGVSLRRAFLGAAFWSGCEWLRGIVLTGFGWNGLGVGLHQNKPLIQIADVAGVAGAAFLPVFVAITVFHAVRRTAAHFREGKRSRLIGWDVAAALALLLLAAAYGWMRLSLCDRQMTSRKDTIPLRVALLQGNIPQAVKWSGENTLEIYQTYADLTEMNAAARDGAAPVDLVVWPESALPISLFEHEVPPEFPRQHPRFFDHLLSLGDFSLLTGAEVQPDPKARMFTSAVLMRGSFKNQQHHHKVHLVPFGEYLPFRDTLPFMEPIFGGILQYDFAKGSAAEPLKLEKPLIQIVPLICFEDTVGRVARRFVRDAPQIIVNLTNDGWFLQSAEMEIHSANSIFRAIELRRPMARCSNTGVTCVMDACGRIPPGGKIEADGGTNVKGSLVREMLVPTSPPITFYARHGDVFSVAMLAIAAVSMILNRRGRPPQPG